MRVLSTEKLHGWMQLMKCGGLGIALAGVLAVGVSHAAAQQVSDPEPGSVGQTASTAQPPSSGTELTLEQSVPGGTHEFGVWGGFSLHSGHYLGYDHDVKFFPLDARYSFRFLLKKRFAVRYSPEITALAILDEPNHPVWDATDPTTPTRVSKGGGISPVGFQFDLRPRERVQPFFSENSGMLYFSQRVLSPQGSQFLFSTDLGLGINFFPTRHHAVTVGYRYQHMSNANISDRNPGTDANTFYVGYSVFHTHGVR